MKNSINFLGWLALICMVLGNIPGLGIISLVIGIILTTYLYAKIDKLGYGTNLLNFTVLQWVIALVPTILLAYYGVDSYLDKAHGLSWLLILLVLALLLFLAITNYFIAKSLLIVAQETNNIWFKISGIFTQIAAYTMPVLIGLLLVALAQPFFLIGCIFYHKKDRR